MLKSTIAIQGYAGSFHDEAATTYFANNDLNLLPADSFEILAGQLSGGQAHYAIMAIENSIAGTILQNYRILRENKFWIEGEVYLRIEHNLVANANTKLEDITEIHSHPMALNQCLDFLKRKLPNAKLVEAEDTALSAIRLKNTPDPAKACIASTRAAAINGLKILSKSIESNKMNYTRFFVLTKTRKDVHPLANKVSLYLRIPDEKGQLLKVLQYIHSHNLNMSKLQSYPVLGSFREYFFHLDIEFDHHEQYLMLKEDLEKVALEIFELGIYKRADLSILNPSSTKKITAV